MSAKNDITGDDIKSRITSNNFRDNFDKIFKSSFVECKRCGKSLVAGDMVTVHTCTPKEGWVDWEEVK